MNHFYLTKYIFIFSRTFLFSNTTKMLDETNWIRYLEIGRRDTVFNKSKVFYSDNFQNPSIISYSFLYTFAYIFYIRHWRQILQQYVYSLITRFLVDNLFVEDIMFRSYCSLEGRWRVLFRKFLILFVSVVTNAIIFVFILPSFDSIR